MKAVLLLPIPSTQICTARRDLSEAASVNDRGGALHDLRFSSDGRLLAVCTSDGVLDLYDPSALGGGGNGPGTAGGGAGAGAGGGKLKRIGECVPTAAPAGAGAGAGTGAGDQQAQAAAQTVLPPANPHNRFLCHVDFSADCKAVQVNNGASERFVFRVPCAPLPRACACACAVRALSYSSV